MKNSEVIRLFIAGDRRAHNTRLFIRAWARGTELVFDQTVLARRGGSWCRIEDGNVTRTIQDELRRQLRNSHLEVIE